MPKRPRSVSPPSVRDLGSNGSPPRGRSASPVSKYSRTTSLEPESQWMVCMLPPHGLIQISSNDFDRHYLQEHTNMCQACNANLPSSWLLELHLRELHDPLIEAERDKGEKTYKCFVETCDKVCAVPAKRRLHMIDKHGYPRDYDFGIVADGITRGRSSLLQRGRARSHDTRMENKRRGGLGKMTDRLARKQESQTVGLTETSNASLQPPTVRVHGPEAMDTETSLGSDLNNLSSKLDSMKLDMTPRSVQLRKAR